MFKVIFDILSLFWFRFVAIGFLALAFVVAQAVLAIVFLTRFSSVSEAPTFFDINFDILALSPVAFGALILLLGTLASGMVFVSRIISISVMTDYEKQCVERVANQLEQNKDAIQKMTLTDLSLLLGKDCRFGGRIANEVAGLVLPLGISSFAFPILFYLNSSATFSLLLVVAFTSYLTFAMRHWAKKASSEIEVAGAQDSSLKSSYSKRLMAWAQGKESDISHERFSMPHKDFITSYRRRLLMPSIGQFVGGIGFSLALCALSIEFIFRSEASDAIYLGVYIYLAFFALSQLRNVSKLYLSYHVFNAFFGRAFNVINGDFSLYSAENGAIEGKGDQELDELEDL